MMKNVFRMLCHSPICFRDAIFLNVGTRLISNCIYIGRLFVIGNRSDFFITKKVHAIQKRIQFCFLAHRPTVKSAYISSPQQLYRNVYIKYSSSDNGNGTQLRVMEYIYRF